MVSHLASFWEWDFLELGNGLLLKTEKNSINFFYLSHNAPCLPPPPKFYIPLVFLKSLEKLNSPGPNLIWIYDDVTDICKMVLTPRNTREGHF